MTGTRLFRFAPLGAAFLFAGCSRPQAQVEAPRTVIAASAVSQPDDGQWLMASKDYANNRFRGLDRINAGNVPNLKLAWSFSTGVLRGHEGALLVVGDTIYPNILYALDLKNQGAKKWEYKPKPLSAAQGVACCDVVNRGAVYWEGKIIYNTLDAQMVAVDAASGKELWKTKLGDINQGETMTMAPLVVKGKVPAGNSGGELGVSGWIAAVDVSNGKEVAMKFRGCEAPPDTAAHCPPGFMPGVNITERDTTDVAAFLCTFD